LANSFPGQVLFANPSRSVSINYSDCCDIYRTFSWTSPVTQWAAGTASFVRTTGVRTHTAGVPDNDSCHIRFG